MLQAAALLEPPNEVYCQCENQQHFRRNEVVQSSIGTDGKILLTEGSILNKYIHQLEIPLINM